MSTPVCIANAVTDALGLRDITLPLVPAKLADAVHGLERVAPAGSTGGDVKKLGGDRKLRGEGEASVGAPAEQVWAMLLDPETLKAVIPVATACRKFRIRISART